MRLCLISCSVLVTAFGIPSQTVHLVGPSGFANVGAALAVATSGDVIHVSPGQYPPFTVNVGVTIRALTGVSGPTPTIGGNPPVAIDVPAGQTVNLVNFEFERVRVTGGRVTLDSCSFSHPAGRLLEVDDATVHLARCNFQGSSPAGYVEGLVANRSDVTAVSSGILGSFGLFSGPAVVLTDSRLHGSDLWLQGGNGFTCASAMIVQGTSQVWLADSVLWANYDRCAIADSGQVIRLDRCTVTNGSVATCVPIPPSGLLVGVAQPQPLTLGAPFQLEYRTEPNGFVAVFASFALDTVDWAPLLEQPSWIAHAQSFVAVVLLADGAGNAPVTFALPAAPYLVNLPLWFTGIGSASLPLQASPIAGGVAR